MEVQERMSKIEGAFEQMNQRLNHIESQLDELRREMGDLRREFHSALNALTYRLLIPMWVTIILAIIALFFKV